MASNKEISEYENYDKIKKFFMDDIIVDSQSYIKYSENMKIFNEIMKAKEKYYLINFFDFLICFSHLQYDEEEKIKKLIINILSLYQTKKDLSIIIQHIFTNILLNRFLKDSNVNFEIVVIIIENIINSEYIIGRYSISHTVTLVNIIETIFTYNFKNHYFIVNHLINLLNNYFLITIIQKLVVNINHLKDILSVINYLTLYEEKIEEIGTDDISLILGTDDISLIYGMLLNFKDKSEEVLLEADGLITNNRIFSHLRSLEGGGLKKKKKIMQGGGEEENAIKIFKFLKICILYGFIKNNTDKNEIKEEIKKKTPSNILQNLGNELIEALAKRKKRRHSSNISNISNNNSNNNSGISGSSGSSGSIKRNSRRSSSSRTAAEQHQQHQHQHQPSSNSSRTAAEQHQQQQQQLYPNFYNFI